MVTIFVKSYINKFLKISTHKVWQDSNMITDQELEKFNDDLRDFDLNVNFNYFDDVRNSCYADK